MTVELSAFTPGPAFLGGLMIGLAVSLLAAFNGRIAGISGIAGGLLRSSTPDKGWRGAFLIGLMAAPVVMAWAHGPGEPGHVGASLPWLALSGWLVGLGTRYGAGCTSGHGVCGVSRLSRRSLVATATFMAAGFATTFVIRHVPSF